MVNGGRMIVKVNDLVGPPKLLSSTHYQQLKNHFD